MAVSTGGHPADHPAVVPDWLISDRIRIRPVHGEGRQPQLAAAFLLLERGSAADELALGEIHEAPQPRFVGAVDRAVLARPGAEALFNAHGVQRAAAEEPEAVRAARLSQQVIERALIVGGYPDLVAKLPGEADAPYQRRHHADIHLAERQEGKRTARQIAARQALEQRARVRSGYREAHVLHGAWAHRDPGRRRVA